MANPKLNKTNLVLDSADSSSKGTGDKKADEAPLMAFPSEADVDLGSRAQAEVHLGSKAAGAIGGGKPMAKALEDFASKLGNQDVPNLDRREVPVLPKPYSLAPNAAPKTAYTSVSLEEMTAMAKGFEAVVAKKDVPVKALCLGQAEIDGINAKGGFETVVVDENGKAMVETKNKAMQPGDWLVTNQIEGQNNSYIVPAAKFEKLYSASATPGVFNPVGDPKTVFVLPEGINLEFEAPWGGAMKIRGGGVLVPDEGKFYGINPEEFKATYSEVSAATTYASVSAEEMTAMVKGFEAVVVKKDVPVKAVCLEQTEIDAINAKGGFETVVIDENGKAMVETKNKAMQPGDWLVTNQIEGQSNSYIVPAAKFAKLYSASETPGVFNPVGDPKTVFVLPQGTNLEFEAPWGGAMKIRGGGVLVPDEGKFYGINPEEFQATYSVEDWKVRLRVAQDRKASSDTLSGLASDPVPMVRHDAVDTLRIQGSKDLSLFTNCASDENAGVRAATAYALENCGPDALPVLERLSADSSENVRYSAAVVLGRFGTAAIPALDRMRDDSEWTVRGGVASALGSIGSKAEMKDSDNSTLCLLVEDKDERVRKAAAIAIDGWRGFIDISTLEKMAKDTNTSVQSIGSNSLSDRYPDYVVKG
jgi:HEAT repeats